MKNKLKWNLYGLPSVNGRAYRLYGSSNLRSGSWSELSSHGANAPTNTSSETVTSDEYFFRVTARKAPSN